jgi:uridine phosphorylase
MPKDPAIPPILANKDYAADSIFTPENLLREARRQRTIGKGTIPPICVLDPDGDIVRVQLTRGKAHLDSVWACYHTQLYRTTIADAEFGIVGNAVGAAFAVLVAEEMFASGCKLLISVTSSGQIIPVQKPPYFVMIDRALRDEGTSYHYMAPSQYAFAPPELLSLLGGAFDRLDIPVFAGGTWTTDAPFRETQHALDGMRDKGLYAVEMEAAALYAFAAVKRRPVICFAHVTNQMGLIQGDFEKGEMDGVDDTLKLINAAADRLRGYLG